MILAFAVTLVVKPLFHQNSLNSLHSPLFFSYFDKNTINSSHHPWPSGCISSCQHVNKHTIGCILIDFVNIKIQFIKRFTLSDSFEILDCICNTNFWLSMKKTILLRFRFFCLFHPPSPPRGGAINYQNYFFALFYDGSFDSDSIQKKTTSSIEGHYLSVIWETRLYRFLLLSPYFGKMHNLW